MRSRKQSSLRPTSRPKETRFPSTGSTAAYNGDLQLIPSEKVQYIDVSPETDGRRFGRSHPVPRARRRQPRAHGLEHAAAGRAAPDPRAAARRDGSGEGSRQALRHARPRSGRRPGGLRRRRAHQAGGEGQDRPRVRAAQVPRTQRADLPQPEADRQDGRQGEEGADHRRRRRHPQRRAVRWAATCWSRSCPGKATTSRTRSSSPSGW